MNMCSDSVREACLRVAGSPGSMQILQAVSVSPTFLHLHPREIRKTATNVWMMEHRIFRMPDWKRQTNVKIMDFRISQMPDLKSPKIDEIVDSRNFRRSQKPSGPGYPRIPKKSQY